MLLAAEREPGNVQVVGSLGEYYLHKEEWRKSARWLTKAFTLSPGSESIGYDLAFARMQAGDLDSAKRQIEQMLGRTDGAKLHSLLGEVEDRRADYLDAAKEYHRAAEIDPSESNIFDLATFLLQHKKYVGFVDESIKFFRYGVSQFPRSSQMMVGLGVALYASEQYDEAVRVLCAAVDLDPTDRRPMEFLGKARKVSPELAEEVDRRLQDFVERYPENAAANYYYAFSLWERGGGEEGKNPDKIEGLLRKAVAQSPGWYEPHYQLGVLYESEKRYPEAIREMQRTIKIEPEFSPAHFRLAVLYNRTGDKSRAAQESAVVQRIKNRDRTDETGGGVGK
jgi:tetratricopeptide (TPR) repeat protein